MKKNIFLRVIAGIFISVFTGSQLPAVSADVTSEVPARDKIYERWRRTSKGVNLSHWINCMHLFSGKEYLVKAIDEINNKKSSNLSVEEKINLIVTDHDLKLLKEWGFKHLRVPFDPETFFNADHPEILSNDHYWNIFEKQIERLLSCGFAVSVDMHNHSWTKSYLVSPENIKKAAIFWQALAKRLKKYNPDFLFFEIANEPGIEIHKWRQIQWELIKGIRAAAPQHTLIASGGGEFAGYEDLPLFVPYENEKNIIYVFHYYVPNIFCHQGAKWYSWKIAGAIQGLDWPVTKESLLKIINTTADPELKKSAGQWIDSGRFLDENEKTMLERFEEISRWSKKYDTLVLCNEFGCTQYFDESGNSLVPARARLYWYKNVVENLEKCNIAWTAWAYSSPFGIVNNVKGAGLYSPKPVVANYELLTVMGMNTGKDIKIDFSDFYSSVTNREYCMQAENTVLSIEGKGSIQEMKFAEAKNGKYIKFDSPGKSNTIIFTLKNIDNGLYDVVIRYNAAPYRGICEINCNKIITTFDQYSSEIIYKNFRIGNVSADKNEIIIKCMISGRNASANAWHLAFDEFTLVPLSK